MNIHTVRDYSIQDRKRIADQARRIADLESEAEALKHRAGNQFFVFLAGMACGTWLFYLVLQVAP